MEAHAVQVSPKSQLAVALLAFFLGTLGLHRFYIGKTNTGLALLFLWIGGWATYWVFLIGVWIMAAVGVWVLYDLVITLAGHMTDSNGLPITRW